MLKAGMPRRGRPGPRPAGSLSGGLRVFAGQAGVLAMVMTAGAIRVMVSFGVACGKDEGDLDLRARCRSRSTTFRKPEISLVTVWEQARPRRIADRAARRVRAKDRSRARTGSPARRPFRAGAAARAAS